MKWKFVAATVIAAASLATACGGSGNPVQPTPAAASPGDSAATAAVPSSGTPPSAGATEAGERLQASCTVVSNGVDVVVSGRQQSDGSVIADHVSLVPPGTRPAPPGGIIEGPSGSASGSATGSFAHGDALGTVAGLRGTCPDVQFTAGGRAVATSAATKFYGLPSRRGP